MEEKPTGRDSSKYASKSWKNRLVLIWAAGVLLLYASGAYFGASLLHGYAIEAEHWRQAWIASSTLELKAPAPSREPSSAAKPVDVLVGVDVNRIDAVSLRDSTWIVGFNIWFRWTGDRLKPGDAFRIVNGDILQQEKWQSYASEGQYYEEYHVVARMTKPFAASRLFPVGEDGLFVEIEDVAHDAEKLRYLPDAHNSGIDSDAIPRNVKLARFLVGVKTQSYQTGLPESGNPEGKKRAHSKFIFAMFMLPESLGVYQKMFQALFASVAIALVSLYIKPIHIDARFGLPVGGFFASVSNNVALVSLLPTADRLTLTDMVNAANLFTIFLILVQSVMSLYLFDTLGRERLSRLFDRVSFAVILIGYAVVNLALPLAARSS